MPNDNPLDRDDPGHQSTSRGEAGKDGRGADKPKDPPEKKTVTITLNGAPREVPKGKMTAAELKVFLGIDASQVLDEVDEEGIFRELADDADVKLRDGLVLVSHGRGGGSS